MHEFIFCWRRWMWRLHVTKGASTFAPLWSHLACFYNRCQSAVIFINRIVECFGYHCGENAKTTQVQCQLFACLFSSDRLHGRTDNPASPHLYGYHCIKRSDNEWLLYSVKIEGNAFLYFLVCIVIPFSFDQRREILCHKAILQVFSKVFELSWQSTPIQEKLLVSSLL